MKNSLVVNGFLIKGLELTQTGGCMHYHSPLDVIAIQFPCCKEFYACHLCHQALADHVEKRWIEFSTKAILCGCCGETYTILKYLSGINSCQKCGNHFNPRCKNHWNLYFDLSDEGN